MAAKSKQKQSQKQEQNVKVVINQSDKKKSKQRKRKQSLRGKASAQPYGPMPIGISSTQAMRNFQTFTPQINSNTASDLNNVINAIRSGLVIPNVRQQDVLARDNMRPPIAVDIRREIDNNMREAIDELRRGQRRMVDGGQQTEPPINIDATEPVRNRPYVEPVSYRNVPSETNVMPSYRRDDEISMLGDGVPDAPSLPEPQSVIAPQSSLPPSRNRFLISTSEIGNIVNSPLKEIRQGSYIIDDIPTSAPSAPSIPTSAPSIPRLSDPLIGSQSRLLRSSLVYDDDNQAGQAAQAAQVPRRGRATPQKQGITEPLLSRDSSDSDSPAARGPVVAQEVPGLRRTLAGEYDRRSAAGKLAYEAEQAELAKKAKNDKDKPTAKPNAIRGVPVPENIDLARAFEQIRI